METIATAVSIGHVDAMAFDRAGNLYISGIECFFKVDKRGIITRIAGTGVWGDSGDGTPALKAQIGTVSDIAVNDSGNVYFSQPAHHRIRQISSTGMLTTVAGTGIAGYSGDGGLAINAQLNQPQGLAFDSQGNLYFSDTRNHRVRKIDQNRVITTVAGVGRSERSGDDGPAIQAALREPYALRVDHAGNIYVADGFRDPIVRKISPSGIITRLIGTEPPGPSVEQREIAKAVSLAGPVKLAVDGDGLFVLEIGNARVRRVSSGGSIVTLLEQPPQRSFSGLIPSNELSAIAAQDDGRLYVADAGLRRVFRIFSISGDSQSQTVVGNGEFSFSGDGGSAVNAQLFGPQDVAVDQAGRMIIADGANSRLRVVSPQGIITTLAGPNDQLSASSIAVDDHGTVFFSSGRWVIGQVSPAGVITFMNIDVHDIYYPMGLTFDRQGNLYFADYCNSRVRKISASGKITTVAGSGKADIREGWSGAACYQSGGYSGDGGPAIQAELWNPSGVAVDASGNIFIADTGNNRIRKVSPTGIISTVAGNGDTGGNGDCGPAVNAQLQKPVDVAVDGSGNLYISDSDNGRIREVFSNGIIGTLVGRDNSCYPGKRGPAIVSPPDFIPRGIFLDPSGNLFVAISIKSQIVKVSPNLTLIPIVGTGNLVPPELLR